LLPGDDIESKLDKLAAMSLYRTRLHVLKCIAPSCALASGTMMQ